ncbi:MAG: ribbon-helix-helix domain-containing protein [Thermodesulfobacteriota bacterium]|nr:ribbon-helix-helix domain-containing protein [Thermodesulfobacteriota bacterium]
MKTLKHLCVDTGLPISTLLEEAIQDLLKKYEIAWMETLLKATRPLWLSQS